MGPNLSSYAPASSSSASQKENLLINVIHLVFPPSAHYSHISIKPDMYIYHLPFQFPNYKNKI